MCKECGCESHHGMESCECGCHDESHGQYKRRFLTKAEKIEKLQNYAEELKKELTAVQEQIKELKD